MEKKAYKVLQDCQISGDWKNINEIIEADPAVVKSHVSNGRLIAVSAKTIAEAEESVESEAPKAPKKKAAKKKAATKG